MTNKYNPMEWEWPKRADQGGKRWTAFERRRYILYLAKSIGLYNVNKSEIARVTGCSRRQVYKSIDAIYKAGVSKEALQQAEVDGDNNTRFAIE